MKKIIKIGLVLSLGLGLGMSTNVMENRLNQQTPMTVEAKSKDSLADAINSDLEDDQLGNTKWSWNDEDEAWEATLDPNSDLYQDMDDGNVALWNSYVRNVKEESQVLAKNHMKKQSYFQLLDPNDDSKTYLQVYKGKVKYNIGENLGN